MIGIAVAAEIPKTRGLRRGAYPSRNLEVRGVKYLKSETRRQ